MLKKPIFIIALHRTGSTLFKNILNSNSNVAMASDEMQLFMPFLNTFGKQFKSFGEINDEEKINNLISYIYSGDIKGTFWKDYRSLNISPETIKKSFLKTNRSLYDIIAVLLEQIRISEKKERVGVKYPLHFSKTKLLKSWFPDCKIILLHRDIRAVCASKLNDVATKKRKEKFGFLFHYLTLIAFIIDYNWLYIYFKFNRKLFFLVDYNDLITKPVNTIKKVCVYCEIEFEEKMLCAKGKESSHSKFKSKGFDKQRIENWRNVLNKTDLFLISFLTLTNRKNFVKWI